MENIKNLHVQPAVVFENEGEKLVLIKGIRMLYLLLMKQIMIRNIPV